MALRILLVDDSGDDRRVLRTLLTREVMLTGYAVEFVEARDGEEGLEQFKKERPHLVVADMLMPRMDGAALCKAIRSLPRGGDVALLLASGFRRDRGATDALRRELAVEVVAKPFEAKELLRVALDRLDAYRRNHPDAAEEWRRTADDARPATHGAAAAAAAPRPAATPPASPSPPAPGAVAPAAISLDRPVRGTLSQHSLPFLLVRAAASETSGTLKLVRGKVRKLIFINQGVPIFVDSNLRSETLGSYLVSHGMVDENQLARALKQARATSKKLGETLVKMGLLDEEQVLTALGAQTRIKLARAMLWQDGMFSFLPGTDFVSRVPNCPVHAVDVVLGALKKMARATDLAELLGTQLDQALALTAAGERFRPRIEKAFGAAVLQRTVCGTSLKELGEAGADLPTMLVLVESLLGTGLAELRPPVEAPPRPVPMAKIATVRKAVSRADGAIITAPPSDEPGPTEQIRLEDLGQEPPLSPTATDDIELFEPGEQVPPIYHEPEDSGVMELPDLDLELVEPGSAAASSAAAEPSPAAAGRGEAEDAPDGEQLREQLLQTYLGIHGKSHYEVLGVEQEAAAAAIEAAYREKLERFSNQRFEGVLQGDDEDKLLELNLIIEQAHAVLSDPDQRGAYDETLARAQAEVEPATDAYGAELFYQEGHTLLKQRDFDGAVAAFRRAVQENPDQPDYHSNLGWALFLSRGRGSAGATAARPHLEHALRIAPESVKALELAGWMERDAGDSVKALDLLSRALKLGPPRQDLFEAVKGLLNTLEDHKELEHQYRRMIFRLRATEPLKTVPLWVDLAYLYLNKLKQPDNARLALDVAAKLAPADPRVKAALNATGAPQPQQWQPVVEGYRRQLLAEPDNLEPLHELVQLHRRGDRPDDAFLAAALLVERGQSTEQERRLCDELAPGRWVRLGRAPTAEELERTKHPDDSRALEDLMAALAPVMLVRYPVTLEEHGSGEERRLQREDFPPSFAAGLDHVAERLGRPLPALFLTEQLGRAMVPLPGEERVLVGADLLAAEEAQVAFAAARALASLPPGRRDIIGRRGSQLKVAVLATVSHCREGVNPPDPDGALVAFRQELQRSGLELEALSKMVDALLTRDSKINLSQWMRAVHCTAARTGLLFCADIRPALQLVQDEPHIVKDLTSFVLGEAYKELRRGLGLALTA